jgi:hypothetical protein
MQISLSRKKKSMMIQILPAKKKTAQLDSENKLVEDTLNQVDQLEGSLMLVVEDTHKLEHIQHFVDLEGLVGMQIEEDILAVEVDSREPVVEDTLAVVGDNREVVVEDIQVVEVDSRAAEEDNKLQMLVVEDN